MLIVWPIPNSWVAAGVTGKMGSGSLQQGVMGCSNLSWQHSLPSAGNSHLDNFPQESQWPALPISTQKNACVGQQCSPQHENPPWTWELYLCGVGGGRR